MDRVPAPRIAFGWWSAGWLPVSITIGDFDAHFDASNVLNDPIEELLDMAIFAMSGRSGTRRVDLWMEPEGWAVEIWPIDAATVGFAVHYDESMFPPELSSEAIIVYRGGQRRRALATALYEGLADLLEWQGVTAGVESDRFWKASDPSTAYPAKLVELERLLASPRPQWL
jgi:hypothetical protein